MSRPLLVAALASGAVLAVPLWRKVPIPTSAAISQLRAPTATGQTE